MEDCLSKSEMRSTGHIYRTGKPHFEYGIASLLKVASQGGWPTHPVVNCQLVNRGWIFEQMKGRSNGRRDPRDEDPYSAERSDEYRQRDDSSRDGYSRDATRRNRNGDREYSDEVGYETLSDKAGKGRRADDSGRQRGNGRRSDYESDRFSNLKTGDQYDDEYSSSKYSDSRDRADPRRQPEKSSSRRNGDGERANGKGRGYDDDYYSKDRYFNLPLEIV
jgi:hypothetical protein